MENLTNKTNFYTQELLQKAIAFAELKHENQKRKILKWPYIIHLHEVVQLLQECDANLKTLIAGALHDTIEDTNTTKEELSELFGSEVSNMVNTLSENKSLPYMERKHLQAERIKNSTTQIKMIKCADCVSNLRAMLYEGKLNDNLWSKFNAPKEDIQKHYFETISALSELENLEMYKLLKELFSKVFVEKKETKKRLVKYCTECRLMKRLPDPDPDDWFCDDDEKYVCSVNNRVLSVANRPYEKQIAPADCPLND